MVAPVAAAAGSVMGPALVGAGSALLGGMMSDRANRRTARENLAYQREFAQHGIQWRVDDAKAAGLHPLFALGANTPSYTPAQTVGSGVGKALAEGGQAIGNALARQQTAEQRQVSELQLRRLRAETELAEERAFGAFLDNMGRNPGLSSPDQGIDQRFLADPAAAVSGGGVGLVQVQPSKATSSARSDPSLEAAATPMWKFYTSTKTGKRIYAPSQEMAEIMETMGESGFSMLALLKKNLRENPNFLLENEDWIPGAREADAAVKMGRSFYDILTDPDTYNSLNPAHRNSIPAYQRRRGFPGATYYPGSGKWR